MPEGQTEVERRYLKYGKKPVQMQKRNIFARIPLPTSLTLGHLPPGEGIWSATNLPAKQKFKRFCNMIGHPGWGGLVCYRYGWIYRSWLWLSGRA